MNAPEGRRRSPAFWLDVVRCFYQRPIAWGALLVSAAFLTYGGGAVMFWFHAIVRGESGPAIANVHHWLLDSTLGFVALTPVLGLILPLAVWRASGGAEPHPKARPWVYVVGAAFVFTLVTGPGPLMHNALAGAGTPLADLATDVFGEKPMSMSHEAHPAHATSPLTDAALQLGVGLPVYLTCTWLALGFVRLTVRASRKTGAARREQLPTVR
jgi:hypothetical protein